MLTPREQGDIGELSALSWLTEQGATVSIPFGHSPDYDLVADLDGRLLRVQVKTATFFRLGRWEVSLATYGGNQSWTGLVKRLDSSPRQPSAAVVAFCSGTETGRPIRSPAVDETPSTIDSPDPRGDVRVAKGTRL
jgi:hypothetical protein